MTPRPSTETSLPKRCTEEPSKSASLKPLLRLWKSRLPVIVVPVLAGLQQLPQERASPPPSEEWSSILCQSALLLGIAGFTGYHRLPFSVTWWVVLLVAFALETNLLLGVATVLSLSILLSWYGLRFLHPQAVTALWGGSPGFSGETFAARAGWQVWDLFVHGVPAIM
ncbi:unnamed protein product, partial [Polarella glacialis]